jgi:signal transduction histidine kinase
MLAFEARRAETRARYQAILDERTRLARELHDTLEQSMAAIRLQLSTVARKLVSAPEQAERNLALARRMLDHALEEARRSVMDLRAHVLESADLLEAVTQQARRMTAGTPVGVDVKATGPPRRLEASEEHHLLRIAQEALANALKHSGCSRVEIELCFADSSTTLVVRDDGRGFAAGDAAPDGHFGLQGIRERADKMGGAFRLLTRPGAGVEIAVVVPAKPGRPTA